MKTMQQNDQWYEVLRHTGEKQYATKTDTGYLLYGAGFTIKEFDAVSVTPVKEVPTDMVKGIASFDGEKETYMRAMCDLNQRWNGWYMPYIHAGDIQRLITAASHDEHILTLKDGNLIFTEMYDGKVENEDVVAPRLFNGEMYYYCGNAGYCFDFKKSRTKKQTNKNN